MNQTILIEKHPWGSSLILNRPEKLNALSPELVQELYDSLQRLQEELPPLLVIKGAGTSFCSGHDLSFPTPSPDDLEQLEGVEKLQKITECIVNFPSPVIAQVSGYALGAGCEIALNCDLIYASDNAVFGFPELKVGLSITQGSSYFLPRAVGLPKAKELLFFSQTISAEKALELRLINEVFPENELVSQVEEKLLFLSKNSAAALKAIKKLFNAGNESTINESLKLEVEELVKLLK